VRCFTAAVRYWCFRNLRICIKHEKKHGAMAVQLSPKAQEYLYRDF